jgi:hypothetical protein
VRAVKPFGVVVPPKLLAHAAVLERKRKGGERVMGREEGRKKRHRV